MTCSNALLDVRRYREALNGPAGQRVQSRRHYETDYFSTNSGDVKYNLCTRAACGIDRNARFLTNWSVDL
jgi:hypothetical protein